MFDIGFMELMLIGIVALLVLGPDKLPGAIRTGALWLGRARRSFNKVKAEIEQQLNTDEIRRQLHNESILADIEKARKSADKLVKETQQDLQKTQDSVNDAISGKKLTTSADEGVPTPAPDPEVSEARERVEERYQALADESDTADPDEATAEQIESAPKPAPVQDFYNTPPEGRVTLTGGKVTAASETPAPPKTRKRKKADDSA